MTTKTADTVAEAFDELLGDDNLEDALDLGQADVDDGIDDEEPEGDDGPEADDGDEESPFTADDDDEDVTDDEDAEESEDDEDDETPETYTVKVQGEEIEVDLDELKSGYQRQEDYTKKTQELSEEREKLEQDRQEVEEQREKVQTFVSSFESDPVNVMQTLVQRTPDPTLATAKLIRGLAESGALEEQFARTFVGDNVVLNQKADQAQENERLARVESELEERKRREQEQQTHQETVAQFEKQWSNAVNRAGLQFESPQQEQELLREVLQYAYDNEISNLEKAYAAYAWENNLQQGPQDQESESQRASKQKQQQTKKKKRAAQSMNPRSAGTGRDAKRGKPASDEEAIRDALEDLIPG